MAYDPGLAARYCREGLWRDELLTDWLDRTVAETPDAAAIVMAEESMTFAELGALSDRLAAGFRRLGIGMGDVVGVQLRNGPYWVAIHVALCRIGAVMTGIHLTFRESECERALAFGEAVAIVCEKAMGDFAIAETMLRLKARLPSLEHVIVAGGGPEGSVALEALEDESWPATERADASGPFIMLYTSGSTSRPKAVPLSYNNLLTNARGSAGVFGITARDRILAAGPFAHLYSLHSPHFSLLTGAAQVILPVYEKSAFVDLVEKTRPTVVFAVPAHIFPCLAEGLLDSRGLVLGASSPGSGSGGFGRPRSGAGLQAAERKGDPALGNDRDAGRPLYAARGSGGLPGDHLRTAEPGNRDPNRYRRWRGAAAGGGGRIAGAGGLGFPRLSSRPGSECRGVHP